jgi:hypothetical protein
MKPAHHLSVHWRHMELHLLRRFRQVLLIYTHCSNVVIWYLKHSNEFCKVLYESRIAVLLQVNNLVTYKERNLLEHPPPSPPDCFATPAAMYRVCSHFYAHWQPYMRLNSSFVQSGLRVSHFAQNNQQVFFLNRINWTVAARDTVF